MCICTRFTCALERGALPNTSTKPNTANNKLRLISHLPDLIAVMNPHLCGFWNDARTHESIRALTSEHSSAKWLLDQECEMLNIFGIGVLLVTALSVVSQSNTVERYCLRHEHHVWCNTRLR